MRPARNNLLPNHETARLPELLQNPQRQTPAFRCRFRRRAVAFQRGAQQDGPRDGRGRRTPWNKSDGQAADCADRRATDAAVSPASTEARAAACTAENQGAAENRRAEAARTTDACRP